MKKVADFFRKKHKNTSQVTNFYIVFPHSHGNIGCFMANHLSQKFPITCTSITYKKFDKVISGKIEKETQEACILVIGYTGIITAENCYKLGIANARKKQIILINLCPQKDENCKNRYILGIPNYIRYHFLVILREGEGASENFLEKMENLTSVLLGGNLISALYQKAVDICDTFGNEINHHIEKLDEFSFQPQLKRITAKYSIEELFLLYINDDDELRSDLLYLIVKNKTEFMEILLSRNPKLQDLKNFNYLKIENKIINQYGRGDNYGGDRIQRDKIMGNSDETP